MAWTNTKGFDFRATLGFVTDPANATFVSESFGAYPQSITVDGDTFNCGWETAPQSAHSVDRDNTVDPRLSGLNYTGSGSGVSPTFRVDLPATGSYVIRWAMGDASSANTQLGQIKDTNTVLINLTETGTTAGQFIDASLVTRTSASDWVTNQVEVTKTFATTIFRVTISPPSALASTLSHFAIRQASGVSNSVWLISQ